MTPPDPRLFYKTESHFPLILGGSLPGFEIAYETWGELDAHKSNVVLLFTGLSSSSHAKSHNRNDTPGWWEAMINQGSGIDMGKHFVICFNYLGGCFGSTGPSSINPETGTHFGPDFPPLLIQDIAAACKMVVDDLGITRVRCAMGASMGGMVAMEYAACYPDHVANLLMISATGRPGASSIAFRYVQRQVVLNDPRYADGWYYDKEEGPSAAMAVARQIGNITYRSRKEFNERFGRSRTLTGYNFGPDFQVESYLHHMGWKLGAAYDANSFMILSKAMDLYSLGYRFPTHERGVERIQARTMIIGVASDMLFPIDEQESVYRILKKAGREISFHVLDSSAGHDAFLVEVDYFKEKLESFFEKARD